MKHKIYYKVLTENLCSINKISSYPNCFQNLNPSHFKLKYTLNKWTYPIIEGTNLMVFSSLIDAKEFASKQLIKPKIFKCHVKNPKNKGIICLSVYNIENHIKDMLIAKKNKKKYCKVSNGTPKGTVFCKAVKLIEQVV